MNYPLLRQLWALFEMFCLDMKFFNKFFCCLDRGLGRWKLPWWFSFCFPQILIVRNWALCKFYHSANSFATLMLILILCSVNFCKFSFYVDTQEISSTSPCRFMKTWSNTFHFMSYPGHLKSLGLDTWDTGTWKWDLGHLW